MLSAYTDEGARWVQAMNGYVLDNIRLVRCFFEKYLPQVHAFENEGAFVLWIDWRSLGLSQSKLHAFLEEQALFLTDHGEEYGLGGEGFTRMNLATPRAEVKKALEHLLSAAKENGFAR